MHEFLHRTGHLFRVARLACVAIGGGSLATACTGVAEPAYVAGYPAVYASPPADVYAYPRAYYNGNYAYNVQGMWYYDDPRGWVVLRSEPPELYRARTYVQQAPPAPRYYYGAPQYGAPRYSAPQYNGGPRYNGAPQYTPRRSYDAPRNMPRPTQIYPRRPDFAPAAPRVR